MGGMGGIGKCPAKSNSQEVLLMCSSRVIYIYRAILVCPRRQVNVEAQERSKYLDET